MSTGPERVAEVAPDVHLAEAERHADLGLPVGRSDRFRLAKRVVVKLGWPFLRHQIAFNHALMQSNRELAERMSRLEQDLRNDLIDFADRSVSQAHAEIGNQAAEARSVNAGLVLELRSLQAELTAMIEALSPVRREGSGGRPEPHDDADTDASGSRR